jgi:hypothetical protein
MTHPQPRAASRLCIQHREGWCALKPGTELDPAAVSDATACGQFVVMRSGSERRQPTCRECRAHFRPDGTYGPTRAEVGE